MAWELLAIGALGVAAVVGLLVWLVRRSEDAATRAANEKSEALSDAAERRKVADDVRAQVSLRGRALLDRLRRKHSAGD